MSLPELTPISKSNKSILPPTGSTSNVNSLALPFGIYVSTDYWSNEQIDSFKKGAVEEVTYVYKRLGGDVLDIEIVESQVYAAYEEAVLEYSYVVNLKHSKNVLSRALGSSTGSFNQSGQLTGSNAEQLSHSELKYTKFNLGYAARVGQAYSSIVDLNGTQPVYSASIPIVEGKQDYDLQAIVSASAAANNIDLNNKRVNIIKVYYKTPAASWNFYGYFGGLNVVGNLSSYGQYADDSSFEIIPTWQNKLQAMAYEDAIKTRISDYSYQLRNNKLRIFPTPLSTTPVKMWFLYTIPSDAFGNDGQDTSDNGTGGVNNFNTLPFENIPYDSINSVGKQWIRRFALALCKEMLGHIRSKFESIPIPGDTYKLNGTSLISEAKTEQKELKEELNKILDETTYDKLMAQDVAIVEASSKVQNFASNLIYVG